MHITRPKLSVSILTLTILSLGFTGLASPYEYNALPSNIILEIAFILSALLSARRINRIETLFVATTSIYIAASLALMYIFKPANILDFIQAYKAYFYIIPLSLIIAKKQLTKPQLELLLFSLTTLLLVKYGYSRLLDLTPRMGSRPGLYSENNFELVLLLIIYYITSRSLTRKSNIIYFLSIAAIIILSGSRSAIVGLVAIFPFIFLQRISYKTFLSLAALLALFFVTAVVFRSRMSGGIETIDRVYFLSIFLYETRTWGILDYLLGNLPLTPLSNLSCEALSAYSDLYSYSGDGSCYSVILHSYLLRVIFDHGLLGLFFILSFTWYGLTKSKFKQKECVCIILTILISGVSVSAFNSIFVVIAIALCFATNNQPHSKIIKCNQHYPMPTYTHSSTPTHI